MLLPKSLGRKDFLFLSQQNQSFTAQTRGGWIPVTSIGKREKKIRPVLTSQRSLVKIALHPSDSIKT
jgi:hypothetical protein